MGGDNDAPAGREKHVHFGDEASVAGAMPLRGRREEGNDGDSPLLSTEEREVLFSQFDTGEKKELLQSGGAADATGGRAVADDGEAHGHRVQAAATGAAADAEYDAMTTLPFVVEHETLPLPASLPPPPAPTATAAAAPRPTARVAGANVGETWLPGSDLLIACCTWNMAAAPPTAAQIRQLIRPNAHLICVSTQENGPYVGLNTRHREWEALLRDDCLQGQYVLVASQTLWAVHIVVFARAADVAPHVEAAEVASVKTGALRCLLGNKGGVGVSLVLSLRAMPLTCSSHPGPEQQFSPRERDGAQPASSSSSSSSPQPSTSPQRKRGGVSRKLSLLFVGAHLAAHQKEIQARNRDFCRIVAELPLGCRSAARRWRRYFLSANGNREGALQRPDDIAVIPSSTASSRGVGGDGGSVEAASAPQRDVTEEFDLVFFLGDLNYRIGGTKRAIENIVANHIALRPVLVHNDQLTQEMAKGFVFCRFCEGALCFRPSYKYHIDAATKLATDEYDLSKKARLPAYCDRVLFKRHRTYTGELLLTHYTDVPPVRSSDHRPVVAMFRARTHAYEAPPPGEPGDGSDDDDGRGCCCGC